MEEPKKKEGCKSIVTNLMNLQLGLDKDQRLVNYHATMQALTNMKATKTLTNDDSLQNCQISEIKFNSKGNLLANCYWANDKIQIWDWFAGKLKHVLSSGHGFTVMHFDWVPCDNDNLLVTSGQQGAIRLTDITTSSSRWILEKGIYRSDSCMLGHGYKFSVTDNLPQCILAAGRTGKILMIDLREEEPTELFVTKYADAKVYDIHSLDINPVKSSEFCVGGMNNVRIYDHRKSSEPIQEFTLVELATETSLSSCRKEEECIDYVKYNYNGTEVLACSTADPIYVLDALKQTEPKRYSVTRTSRHGYNIYNAHFCGQRSEFIITISVVSENFHRFNRMYIWEKETQKVLRKQTLQSESWSFAVHPTLPVLAMNWNHDGMHIWQ